MPYQAGLTHTIPELKTGAKHCSRCGKEFHLFRSKKNCRNCGCMVCESCSSFKTKLPQFGYFQDVRVCSYCAHFLHVYRMDTAALSKLNIKTLRGYLQSYDISTKGMLEKQELISAIQSHRPIPDRSEIYFRAHLPPDATPGSSSFFDDLFGSGSEPESSASGSGSGARGRNTSGMGSSTSSSASDNGSGWSWDPDKFFSKLFGFDDHSESSRSSQPQAARRSSKPTSRPANPQPAHHAYPTQQHHQPSSQPRPYPHPQPQASPHAAYPNSYPRMPPGYSPAPPYLAQQHAPSWTSPQDTTYNGHYNHSGFSYPNTNSYPGSTSHQRYYQEGPPSAQPQSHAPNSYNSHSEPQHTSSSSAYSRPTENARLTENSRPTGTANRPQTQATGTSTTYTATSETFTRTSRAYSSSSPNVPRQPSSQSPQQPSSSTGGIITLEDVMLSSVNISTLSIKVIKTLLDSHSVTYVGVVEKADLVERLKTLIDNTKAEQGIKDPTPPPSVPPRSPQSPREETMPSSSRMEDNKDDDARGKGSGINSEEKDATKSATTQPSHHDEDEDMCKICYDAKLNCVMLNCGHLATCQPCGKLIMDGTRTCPICRQYVIRLLHVFRA